MERDVLVDLSKRTADLVATASAHVVRVEGRRRGAASGVVWSQDGVVVTANHALERDEGIEVFLPSEQEVRGEVLGRDPTTDLAVVRAGASGLSAAAFAETDALAAGELVLAISRPGRSARAGLGLLARSAGEWRTPAGGRVDRFLETTLDLHPGLSGALALRADGAAIGIATAGLVRGAAMILPAATLRRVVKSLLAHGGVRRGYIGVAMVPVRLPAALAGGAGQAEALLVSSVEPDSPAARAGLLLGDALLSIGGRSVTDPSDVLPVLEEERIGDAVAVRVVRAGEVREATVTIGARERGRHP
jgi:S1-C subfamily serine protease